MTGAASPAPGAEEIRAVIADVIGGIAPEVHLAAVDPDRPLREQVDIDSFDFLNVIIRLHEVLGIDIPERDYGELATLNQAVAYLARRCAASREAGA